MPPQYTPSASELARFWSNVDRSGGPDACWLWTGYRFAKGYGQFYGDDRYHWRANRYVWTITHGVIPAGKLVCHDCPTGDNPACVNPAHLFLGTSLQNSRDMVTKGRAARGEHHGSRSHPERLPRGEENKMAKITADDVRAIRAASACGERQRAIAERFGISQQTVSRIVCAALWRHVT